jgi:spore coat protein U-like protein
MRTKFYTSIKFIMALYLLLHCSLALAVMCTISTQSVNFGSYDVFSNSSLESTGNISINCDSTASYTISLSSGSGTFSDRTLTFSSYQLSYNLFIDAARTMIWGDGSGGASAVSGMASTTANHIVYGRVPARQNAYVGNYNDNVNVTISF